MPANPRDHEAVRAERAGSKAVGLQCAGCGAWFLLAPTLARHRAAEIPGFVAAAADARDLWEATRRRYGDPLEPLPVQS